MLISTWRRLTNLGIDSNTSTDERNKTKLINVCYWMMLPLFVLFTVITVLEGRYLLAAINSTVAVVSVMFLTMNYLHSLKGARVALLVVTSVCFTLAAFFYNSGSEYFLLVNMVITALVYKKRSVALPLIVLQAVIFVYLVYHVHYSGVVLEKLPDSRILLRIGVAVLILLLGIQYFVRENDRATRQLQSNNRKMAVQQQKLIEQTKLLEASNKQLEVLNNTKEKLFTIVAHDMRSPIAALKSSLDLFNNDVITREEFQTLSLQLGVQVDQLWDNLENLLQWSKSQLAGIEIHPDRVFLKSVLLDVLALLNTNLMNKKIQVTIDCAEVSSAYADVNQVKIIIRNLLTNAIKFSNVGSKIVVTVLNKDDRVCLSVQDFGLGMSDEQLKQLFSYNKRPMRGTLNEKGSGLGLVLSKEFAERNGGSIAVTSVQGEGSVFTLCLPEA